ncbi:MAG: fumarylacetoacetate hydrolase family protein [Bacteroidales bacterium]|nr:fumarylacetoacetate hydrolase family protein [Bacteroidales bacterium]MDD3431584.1 fumarylacetoacetate hydrolase family protein [Bacteroidales bacterium]MDD4361894.1 fumarylacetoacetate hydrolase family protein [Bacteroidales bacterium]
MKIIAVGMNYLPHIQELNSERPEEPVLFLKPDSALCSDKQPFFLPDFSQEIHYETELVVKISKLGKNIAEKFAHRYYDEISLGLDLTARDLQRNLRARGLPWEISKGFDQSAVVGHFIPKDRFENIQQLHFRLDLNGKTVQQGSTAEMLFGVDRIIAYASRFFTLKTGDLFFTGTPCGVGPVHKEDHLEAWLEGEKMLHLRVK